MILLRQKGSNHREDEGLLTQHEMLITENSLPDCYNQDSGAQGGQNHTINIYSRILSWAGTIRFPVATHLILVL